jgi:NADH-quinone oxidoreductase subunit L
MCKWIIHDGRSFNGALYTWAISGGLQFDLGFMLDKLTAVMILMVTFISLLIHIYSIGYMKNDPGYQRFFSYVSLFTFAMLMLLSANNFLQLFFGWEAVGLVSYLLIGFWFEEPAAIEGNFKAFLVNRVGDFGFLLGLAVLLVTVGSLDYNTVFSRASLLVASHYSIFPGTSWTAISLVCVLLFIGAMGKSAQMPLHVWLPESMQGPTPISALIHAATMVTAGVFMVTRLSPLYELSQPALTLILIVGSTGALFLGLLAFVSYDIKRIIAYSTMSQLGYMMAANGALAFHISIFHLLMHAFFKALLFLAAGAVLIAMHDEHDIRQMGGLRKYMPITYSTFLIGALSLSAIPPFSGFYSKDLIIEAVHFSTMAGAHYAYVCLLLGSFVTAFYIFREFFYVFHGEPRMSPEVKSQLKEAPSSMLFAQVMLAIPSVALGAIVYALLFSVSGHTSMKLTLPFWLSVSGIFFAWLCVLGKPAYADFLAVRLKWIALLLKNQYGFDAINRLVFVKGVLSVSKLFFHYIDEMIIDRWFVDGTGRDVMWTARFFKRLQSGYIYHYVFVMIIAVVVLLLLMFVWK